MKTIYFFTFALFSFLIVHSTLIIENCSAQWQPEVRLTNNPASSSAGFGASHTIAANGNVIHTVWIDNRDGNNELYYKRSTDNGLTWGTDTRLTNDTAFSIHPSISVSGLFVHVTWTDKRDGTHEVYYKRSTDGGLSWGADTRLRDVLTGTSYNYSSITTSGSNLHVVWFDWRDGNAEIYYKKSTDNGDTWSADTRLSNNAGLSFIPVVAVSGSNVHVVWYDSTNGNWEIYYKRSTDNGTSWGADTRLTNNSSDSKWPSITVSGSIVHVAWTDNRSGTYGIYYKRSTNGGTSWSSDVSLTRKNYFNIYPCLTVNGTNVHLVYQNLNNHGNGYDIMYNTSINNGSSWGTEVQLTNNASASTYASIVFSGSALHVIFMDDRNGNNEIYYKEKLNAPIGGPLEITNKNSEIPTVYALFQNYPNPFNPSTKIRFALPVSSIAKLVIFDELGRELETLVNEQLNSGTYEAVWSSTKFSSGIYFYKLTAGEYSQTNKMILLK
jgi:hypothetical protein